MDLNKYLDRIGFEGQAHADLDTLKRVHRGHVERIPYENLAVQLGAPVTRAAADAFEKIVINGRGGWCYEMNGLLGWALEEIGFTVRRLAGAVMRDQRGDSAIGNHLVLLVDLDGAMLVDAGFGDGLVEPIALREGPFRNDAFECRLEKLPGGWWRYHNDPRGSAPSYDFHEEVTDEALLEGMCRWLQSSDDSPFVQNAVVQRWDRGAHLSLRGRCFTRIERNARDRHLIDTADDYSHALREYFGLELPQSVSLWPKIAARHEALFGGESPAAR